MDISNSDEEAENKYLKTYKPFFRKLYEFPEIKAVIHFSGMLLEWFEEKHPEVIMLIEELVKKRKQLEVLGGGYYEPILPMLSPQDRTGQLESLTTALRKKFGKRPPGCWITKSIWDNSLILPIRNSGMDYVFLDYSLLDNIPDESLYTPFITEDSGKLISVFPVHSTLSSLHGQEAEKYIDILKQQIKTPGPDKVISLIFSDKDIEKKSEECVEQFFRKIQEDKNIKTVHPSSLIKSLKLQKRYVKNTECYKNILAENYEVNLVYSRMIELQALINQVKGDKYKKESATDFLWAGQNYISYVSDFYDKNNDAQKKKKSRLKAYKNFMEAELATRQKGVFIPSLFKNDFDMDGVDEFLFHGDEYNAFIHVEGASLFELDYLKNKWNYCYSIDNSNANKQLRKSFCDYFVDIDKECSNISDFIKYDEANIIYDEYVVNSFDREQKAVTFLYKAKNQKNGFAFKILKQYKFNKKNFEVFYTIINAGSKTINYQFGIGLFLSMINKDDTSGSGCTNKNNKIFLEDSHTTITINLETAHNIFLEEQKEDNIYSYTSVMPVYRIENLEPGKTWEARIEVKL
ncbi:MAG: hypothetical protein FWD87_04570 [Spirochaetaceae bacterium]|nr:hypothetical protein [Spirochaetaceae bacterium]